MRRWINIFCKCTPCCQWPSGEYKPGSATLSFALLHLYSLSPSDYCLDHSGGGCPNSQTLSVLLSVKQSSTLWTFRREARLMRGPRKATTRPEEVLIGHLFWGDDPFLSTQFVWLPGYAELSKYITQVLREGPDSHCHNSSRIWGHRKICALPYAV